MKAFVNTLILAFAITAASFNPANANPNHPKKAAAFQTGIYTTTQGKLQVAIQKETTSPILVQLRNAKGEEVFSQRMAKRQQAVRFRMDVSHLPDGVYQVVVSNGVETTTKEVTLATQQPVATPRLVAIH
ncbi:hypothetical protein GCM10027347_53630 [Larkinella harenae]